MRRWRRGRRFGGRSKYSCRVLRAFGGSQSDLQFRRHKDDEEEAKEKKPAKSSSSSASKAAPKKKWAEYIDHATTSHGDNFSDEPEKAINQTDSSKKYKLQPKELAALAYFGKPNPKYGNTTKCMLPFSDCVRGM